VCVFDSFTLIVEILSGGRKLFYVKTCPLNIFMNNSNKPILHKIHYLLSLAGVFLFFYIFQPKLSCMVMSMAMVDGYICNYVHVSSSKSVCVCVCVFDSYSLKFLVSVVWCCRLKLAL